MIEVGITHSLTWTPPPSSFLEERTEPAAFVRAGHEGSVGGECGERGRRGRFGLRE